jgi:hypothetical protein
LPASLRSDGVRAAIPTVRFKGLPAEVVGYWSLWRITLDHQSLRDVKIIPIFHRTWTFKAE